MLLPAKKKSSFTRRRTTTTTVIRTCGVLVFVNVVNVSSFSIEFSFFDSLQEEQMVTKIN